MFKNPKAQGSSVGDSKPLAPGEAGKTGAEAQFQLLTLSVKAGCFLQCSRPLAPTPKSGGNQERFPEPLSDLPNP